jgi:hypothetical protein
MTDTTIPDAPAPEAQDLRSLSDIIGRPNDDMHVPEAGASHEQPPAPAPAVAEPNAPPAPKVETAAPAPASVAAENPDLAAKPEAQQPFWYRKEIKKERDRASALERENAELRGARQQQPQTRAPDPLESPDQFAGYIDQRLETQRLVDRLERSEERLSDKLGDAVVDEVREWLTTRPDLEQWAMGQRDPWKAAHQQFTKEKLAAEIGDDPNTWREQERERLRQEILAEQARDTRHEPAPRPAMNPNRAAPPPPSSTVRSAAPRDDAGRFAGPAPLKTILRNP